jgi:hypothetical protein
MLTESSQRRGPRDLGRSKESSRGGPAFRALCEGWGSLFVGINPNPIGCTNIKMARLCIRARLQPRRFMARKGWGAVEAQLSHFPALSRKERGTRMGHPRSKIRAKGWASPLKVRARLVGAGGFRFLQTNEHQ